VLDAVVAERHVLVTFAPEAPPADVACTIEQAAASASPPHEAREHLVRVRYDGPDLSDVARAARVAEREVPEMHAARRYEVAVIGFQPGFAYLSGIDSRLVLPRRTSPRARVPALSVAVAGPYTGIYPFASPGGWNLIGVAVGFAPFDAAAGAALSLGDRVRFVAELS
jgi:UPF0271 protein